MPASALQDPPLVQLSRLQEGPDILSVYLALVPGRSISRGHRPELMNALRDARQDFDGGTLESFNSEADRVLEYLTDDFDVKGRTLVCFSSRQRNLWLALPLQVEIPTTIRFEPLPYLLPLDQEISLHRICIAIVDRAQSRLLTARLGSIEQDEHSRDLLPRKERQMGRKHPMMRRAGIGSSGVQGERGPGDASSNFDASQEEWVLEHFQKTIGDINERESEQPFSRLVLGGATETLSRFAELLPDDLQRKLSGTFAAEIFDSAESIEEQAMAVVREQRDQEDDRLVRTAIDAAKAGGPGSIGWDDAMRGLIEGRIHQLLVDADSRPQGARCPNGHYIAFEPMRCPACGAQPETVADLAGLAARLCHKTDAEYRLVSGPGRELLQDRGVVAILRF